MHESDEYKFAYEIGFVRLHRPLTNSWITYRLPIMMSLEEVDIHLMKEFGCTEFGEAGVPGWEHVSSCDVNPDKPGSDDWMMNI